MEFDFGTILYILITIIAIIAGVAGKKKKPASRPESAESPDSESGDGFFDRLERQFSEFGEETRQQAREEEETREEAQPDAVVYQPVEEASERINSGKEEDSRSSEAHFEGLYDPEKQENVDIMRSEAEQSGEALEVVDLEDEAEGGADYFEIVKDFDLGTAVIYSAIINRREY